MEADRSTAPAKTAARPLQGTPATVHTVTNAVAQTSRSLIWLQRDGVLLGGESHPSNLDTHDQDPQTEGIATSGAIDT